MNESGKTKQNKNKQTNKTITVVYAMYFLQL